MRSALAIARRRLPMLAPLFLLAACGASTSPGSADVQLDLKPVVTGLSSPVHLTAPAGDARLFVVEQAGRIRVVKGGQLLATPFLDIASRVLSGGERGLLSVAFDPAYATNGYFYVYYTAAPSGDITIERYSATAGADVASTTSSPVLTIAHRDFSNHNGGLALFGPDGMLYIGTGDGGSGGDPFGNGQNLTSLLGKLLRIDVRTAPYTIPSTNPFVGMANRRGEIWAYGLRNPWRFAFDRRAVDASAGLFIADVGQNLYEEIDVAPSTAAGLNYGWNVMEGAHCYSPSSGCSQAGLQLPVHEYGRSRGCSVIGGYVYRGVAIPELSGHYFYSDYCTGFLASLSGSPAAGFTSRDWAVPAVGNVLSFGEDATGELYVLSGNGTVYRIVRKS
jgi:glucose/arabinose dehydrogenase